MHPLRSIFSIFSLIIFMSNVSWAEQPIRILSLDGGGIRGIMEVIALSTIEKELGKPVSQIFDLIAGSSTGGLIALGLSIGDENKQPVYSAASLLPFYIQLGKDVFRSSLRHKIASGFGLWGPKYQNKGLEKHLRLVLGDRMMSEAIVPIMLTGYHVEGETGIEFSSQDAVRFPEDKDCLMREVGLATSAAPVYFDLANVNFSWGVLRAVADGGLYRNNPALLAYVNARRMYPNRTIEVYSFGAGKIGAEELEKQLNGRGLLHWLAPIIKHFQIGDVEADNAMLHKLLNEDGEQNFFRIDIDIHRPFRDMDKVDKKNLDYLVRRGHQLTQMPMFISMLEHLKYE